MARSALDPYRIEAKAALLDRALAKRRAERLAWRSDASKRAADKRRPKLWRDPIYNAMVDF